MEGDKARPFNIYLFGMQGRGRKDFLMGIASNMDCRLPLKLLHFQLLQTTTECGFGGHDHRFGQVGADSSAWGLDFADESAPTNCTKIEAPVKAGRNNEQRRLADNNGTLKKSG